jgi:hypothetical protein
VVFGYRNGFFHPNPKPVPHFTVTYCHCQAFQNTELHVALVNKQPKYFTTSKQAALTFLRPNKKTGVVPVTGVGVPPTQRFLPPKK